MNITLLAKKGGVGKSTVSLLLYEAFRVAGKTVALRDWDAQGTSTKALEMIHPDEKRLAAKTQASLSSTHHQAWNIPRRRLP